MVKCGHHQQWQALHEIRNERFQMYVSCSASGACEAAPCGASAHWGRADGMDPGSLCHLKHVLGSKGIKHSSR